MSKRRESDGNLTIGIRGFNRLKSSRLHAYVVAPNPFNRFKLDIRWSQFFASWLVVIAFVFFDVDRASPNTVGFLQFWRCAVRGWVLLKNYLHRSLTG